MGFPFTRANDTAIANKHSAALVPIHTSCIFALRPDFASMASENRVPPSDPAPTRRTISPPFYRVEQRAPDGQSRHFVVHTQSPKFLVEFEKPASGKASGEGGAGRRPVIKRVCVPNSWAGDYHQCASQLGAASDFYAATEPHGE